MAAVNPKTGTVPSVLSLLASGFDSYHRRGIMLRPKINDIKIPAFAISLFGFYGPAPSIPPVPWRWVVPALSMNM